MEEGAQKKARPAAMEEERGDREWVREGFWVAFVRPREQMFEVEREE